MEAQWPGQRTALPKSHPAWAEEEPLGPLKVIEQIWLLYISTQNQTKDQLYRFISPEDRMKQGCGTTDMLWSEQYWVQASGKESPGGQ